MNISTLRIAVKCAVLTVITLLGALTYAFFSLRNASSDLSAVNAKQIHSYLLAYELRQSSDDLTRLARTYVITANPEYEREYLAVLDIRNGKAPRPEAYHRIYWDFVAAGQLKPRPDTPLSIPLQQMMKEAGFTDAEFTKLKEAEANSNGLVDLEVKAMNAVKGKFQDASGNYTKNAPPDLALARELMHSKEYHQFKAQIMKPLDDFFVLMETRTRDEVARADKTEERAQFLFLALMLAAVLAIAVLIYLGQRQTSALLGAKPEILERILSEIAQGNLAIDVPPADPQSALGRLSATRDRLHDLIKRFQSEAILVGTGVDSLRTSTDRVHHDIHEMTEIIEANSATIEELTVSITHIASNTEEAKASMETTSQLSESSVASVRKAAEEADRVRNSVQTVGETMVAMATRSNEINSIVEVIKEIADQTNLLALNAAIEAARAGEQGRGFAVVADEVRKLAERTGKATVEIGGMIAAIRHEMDNAHSSMNGAAATVQTNVDISTQAVDQISTMRENMAEAVHSMQKIADATHEQSSATTEIASSVERINIKTQSTQSQVQDTAIALQNLQTRVSAMLEVARQFRIH